MKTIVRVLGAVALLAGAAPAAMADEPCYDSPQAPTYVVPSAPPPAVYRYDRYDDDGYAPRARYWQERREEMRRRRMEAYRRWRWHEWREHQRGWDRY